MKNLNKKGFTLIEIIVALTIFGLIMVSVISVYITTSETSYNSELNRSTQENVKNIVIDVSEEITKNSIKGLYNGSSSDCTGELLLPEENNRKVVDSNMLCLNNVTYYLGKKQGEGFVKAQDSDCDKADSECFLIKHKDRNSDPLTNGLVTIRSLKFRLTGEDSKKVTISVAIQPSTKAGLKPSSAERNIFYFQTTITEKEEEKYIETNQN